MEHQRASAAFSTKLSNGRSFSGKNMYDGVFGGRSKIASRVKDYAVIFGGGAGSSIPFLDVPELNERKFPVDVSSSKLDYSNIFGGFGDFDFAVSHEEFIAKPTRDKKTPAKMRSHSEGSFSYPSSIPVVNQVLSNDQASHESGNGVKHFKMSYDASSPGSQSGIKGTNVPPSAAVSKQNSKRLDEFLNESKSNGSDFNDVLFGFYDVGRITPPSKVTRASSALNNKGGNKHDSLKLGVSRTRSHSLDGDEGVSSPPYFDDEVDANSVAATSAAAVKKAIEEARARLKIAKEMMERRKGRIGRVKPSFNSISKAGERKTAEDTVKRNNFGQDKDRETCEKIDASIQTSAGVRKQNLMKVGQVAAESEEREKSFIAGEAAGGTCAKNPISSQAACRQEGAAEREAAKQGERKKDEMLALQEYEREVKKIIEKPEKYGEKSQVMEDATAWEYKRKLDASRELCHKKECLHKLKPDVDIHDQKEDETEQRFSEQLEETEQKVCNELEACERKLKDPKEPTEDEIKVEIQELKDIDNLKRVTDAQEWVDMEAKEEHMLKQQENGYALKDLFEKEENEMLTRDVFLQKGFEMISEEAFEISELKEEHKEASADDACNREDNDQLSDKMEKPEIIYLRQNGFDYEEERDSRLEENSDSLGSEEFMEAEENGDLLLDAYWMEAQTEAPESVGTEEMQKQTDQRTDEMTEAKEDALECCQEDLEAAKAAYNENEINNIYETLEPSTNEDSCEMTPELLIHEENEGVVEGSKAYTQSKESRRDSEAVEVEVANGLKDNLAFDKADFAESNLNLTEIEQQKENTREAFDFDRSGIDINRADITFEQNQYEKHSKESARICTMEKHVVELACETDDVREVKFGLKQEENKYNFEYSDEARLVDSQLHCKFREKHETTNIAYETETRQSTEYNVESHHETLSREERETKIASQEEVKLVKEQQRRVDEAKEREREREKERIAVGRAIREARQRAFTEARERAAAGRTNVAARHKVKAEAEGESTKPSAEANDKTSMEAKLKAERTAVERATTEARQRALEKALSEKASFGSRNQAEKSSDAKHGCQYYDSRYKGSCPPETSRYPNSSNQSASKSSEWSDGATSESAQRCKARFERHQRTTERAAKALAEKNKRDLLAQKEQAERNRLAETLDAEVKRWSSGKQGNLRALLSTLQYILGPDCGWQPIPLTDIIATAAVKKAYRKATLCVHPDKLQQRGASIHQKYICEKVFDLLKEAWNKFSAEER